MPTPDISSEILCAHIYWCYQTLKIKAQWKGERKLKNNRLCKAMQCVFTISQTFHVWNSARTIWNNIGGNFVVNKRKYTFTRDVYNLREKSFGSRVHTHPLFKFYFNVFWMSKKNLKKYLWVYFHFLCVHKSRHFMWPV